MRKRTHSFDAPGAGLVQISAIDQRGLGCGRLADSRLAQARGALPGDLIRVAEHILVDDDRSVRALTWSMEQPAAERRPPPCPAAEQCGGCSLMGLRGSAQQRVKLARVEAALAASAARRPPPPIEVGWDRTAPLATGYRNRVRLTVQGNGTVRFFNRAKLPGCMVLDPALRERVRQIVNHSESQPDCFRRYSHMEVQADSLFLHRRSAGPAPISWEPPGLLLAVAGVEPPESAPSRRHQLTDTVYCHVPLGSFMQVYPAVNRQVLRHIRDGALARRVANFADLFCGSGNFTLPLLAAGLPGAAVEQDTAAVAALLRAAAEQGLVGLEAVAGDARATSERWLARGLRFDLVVADPPRAGLGAMARTVADLAGQFVALCSCNPESLARDLVLLTDAGFQLQQVTAFDMFPWTHHVETVVWLKRVPLR